MAAEDADPAGVLLRFWPIILAVLGWIGWGVHKVVTEPRARLAMVEDQIASMEQLREDVAEIRVALAAMSDAHTAAIREQTARIDRMLEYLIVQPPRRQPRTIDPNIEAG